MASKIEEKKYAYFYFGSVNRRVNPVLMRDEELLDLINWWSPQIGAKEVRPGLQTYLNQVDTNKVVKMFYFKFPNPSIGKKLLRFSGNKIYAVDPNSASNWGSALYTHSENWTNPDATILNGKVHIVDQNSSGVGYYIEWNGNTFTLTNYTSGSNVVVPHRGRTIVQFHRRIYVGSPYYPPNTYRSYIAWSSIDYVNKGSSPSSPFTTIQDDISSANYRPIDIDYKGNIIKLTNINDRLNIYKEEGIYRYNESMVFLLFGLSPFAGSIATMEETREDYFLTNEGFFKTDGKSVTPIGVGWYPIIKQILKNGIDTSKINSYAVNFLYFCYLGNISYDGQTIANACFVYDANLDEMWLWSFAYDISSICHYVDNSGEKQIVLGTSNGRTFRLNRFVHDDAGQPITASFRTKYFFFDDPTKYNQISEIYGFTDPGQELEIYLDKDYNNEYKLVASVSGYSSKARINYDRLGSFKELSAKIVWNGKGQRPTFRGLVFNIKQSSERI